MSNWSNLRLQKKRDNEDDDNDDDFEHKRSGLRSKESVLYQVQLLFGYLMKSQKKYYDTMPLCRVLRGFDGQPLPVGEQQDVNEFCARLFDQLEANLKGTSHDKCIDSAFGGTLMNQMISQEECNHKSEREEPFHTVSLTVKNKAALKESLESYVKGDILDGDNKWLCSKCDDKRAALKRSCFGKLPKYLILHLSRFEFDFNTMRRKKLNTRFEFPLDLNMEKYTREGLVRAEKEKEAEKAAKEKAKQAKRKKTEQKEDGADTETETEAEAETKAEEDEAGDGEEEEAAKEEKKEENKDEEAELPSYPPEYYEYRLVGVVVHTGGAEAGHYYSYAQSSDGKWWEFNDVDVLPFDAADLDQETFGGKHFVTIDDPKEKGKKVRKECDKPYNAYMLIYKQVLAEKNEQKDAQKKFKTFEQEEQALTLPPPIQQTIWSENLKFLCDKNVFDFDYLTFLWQTIQLASLRSFAVSSYSTSPSMTTSPSQSEEKDNEENNNESNNSRALPVAELSWYSDGLQAIQIATCFVFEILIRAKDNGTFPRWMRQLYKMYQQSEIGRKWFLNKVCTQQDWFINTMFYNAHKPARLAFGDLLLAIVHYQSVADRKYYDEFVENVSRIDDMKHDAQYVDDGDDNEEDEDGTSLPRNQYTSWPQIETNGKSSVRGMGDIVAALNKDRFSVARFIVYVFRFLHLAPKFHRSYEEFFILLKGIAHVSWHERKLLINLGAIRSIVAFYLNDTQILHFNRQVVGRSDQGQRQLRRISPPRVHDVIKLLSVLIRSASTSTFPPPVVKKGTVAKTQSNGTAKQAQQEEPDLPPDAEEELPDIPPEAEEENVNKADNQDQQVELAQTSDDKQPNTQQDRIIVEEESVSIQQHNVTTANTTKTSKGDAVDDDDENKYYNGEFEEKSLEFGFAPHFTRLGNGRGRGIALPEEDRRCIWNGLDMTLGQANETLTWSVPKAIDPLPSYAEYNRFLENQQLLQKYRKQHGKDAILPSNLQEIADKIEKKRNLMSAPRKLLNINIVDCLFKDRTGAGNSCLYAEQCVQIIVYWCFNNWILSETMFDYLHRKVAEEFKASHEYGPYLKCIEELLLSKDMFYQKKIETFVPKMVQLLRRCAKTDDTGTDLLLFQLTSCLISLSFKNELIASIVKHDEELLEEVQEEYRANHSHYGIPTGYGAAGNSYRGPSGAHSNGGPQSGDKKMNLKAFQMRRQ